MRKYITYLVATLAFTAFFGGMTSAQNFVLPLPDPKLCDPLVQNVDDETEDDEQIEETRVRRFDQEVRETLKSEQAIMDALYEEKWDLKTGASVARTELCQDEPSYVTHWAELMSQNKAGEFIVLAEGAFSFRKDGTFEFIFKKRPYLGSWTLENARMSLQADWLNAGAPMIAPVDAVKTPVEVRFADGSTDTYDEEVFGVGWFRFMRSETTEKGKFKDCACPKPNEG